MKKCKDCMNYKFEKCLLNNTPTWILNKKLNCEEHIPVKLLTNTCIEVGLYGFDCSVLHFDRIYVLPYKDTVTLDCYKDGTEFHNYQNKFHFKFTVAKSDIQQEYEQQIQIKQPKYFMVERVDCNASTTH